MQLFFRFLKRAYCSRYFFVLFFVTALFFDLSSQNKIPVHPYPSYREIVRHFFDTYSAKANKKEDQLYRFEKRPDGWFLTVRESAEQGLVNKYLLWSSETGYFLKTEMEPKGKEEDNSHDKDLFLAHFEESHYDACPYFGYIGWDWNVCQDYKDLKDLPDTTLYGVGRAYSSMASSLLNNNSGFADQSRTYQLRAGTDCLSAAQLTEYRYYRHKAIEAFRMVADRNPDFETLVGSIITKWQHEHVTSFLDLRMYQNESEAMKELPDKLYTGFSRSVAYNYLASCDKNAILFVNGDGDTYPLLYLQAKEKVRQDVTVVNCSLLQATRYVEQLRRGSPIDPPLEFSLSEKELENDKFSFVLVQDDSSTYRNLGKLLKTLHTAESDFAYGNVTYKFLPGKSISLGSGSKYIEWFLPFNSYIYQSALMQLDLINNYYTKRPIYFAMSLAPESYVGLDYHMRIEGMGYRLMQKKNPPSPDGNPISNHQQLKKHLVQDYSWEGTDKTARLDFMQVENFGRQFFFLARDYAQMGEKQNAISTLDRYFELFSKEKFPYNYGNLDMAHIYFEAGNVKKGNEIMQGVLQNLANKTIHQPGPYDSFTFEEYAKASREKIKMLAEQHAQMELYKDLGQ